MQRREFITLLSGAASVAGGIAQDGTRIWRDIGFRVN
jgi:hypothetical protein